LASSSGMRAASSGKLIWQWESINMARLYLITPCLRIRSSLRLPVMLAAGLRFAGA
jgi:hypothetical protein